MAESTVYVLALLLLTVVAFVAVISVLTLLTLGVNRVIYGKSDESEDDYGPVFGAQPEPTPVGTKLVVGAVITIAVLSSLPLSLWTLKQTGLTAPWLAPLTTQDYERQRKEAESEMLLSSKKLQDTKDALEKLQKLTDAERQAITHSQADSWNFGYISGVSQSIVASILMAIALAGWKRWGRQAR